MRTEDFRRFWRRRLEALAVELARGARERRLRDNDGGRDRRGPDQRKDET